MQKADKVLRKGIRTDGLDVGYGKSPLIKNISLYASPGTIFTLIGPNGSGKSTVLKSITGQLRKMGGTVYLDGNDMDGLRRDEIAKAMSVMMTERPHTELMSCREVAATGRYPYTGRLGILGPADWGSGGSCDGDSGSGRHCAAGLYKDQ